MEKNVLNTDSITTLTDQQFIALKLDYDAWATKPLLDKYKVGGIPTFIVIDAQEVVQRQAVGVLRVGQFVAFLSQPWEPNLKMAAITEMTQFRYEIKKRDQAKWNVEVGVQAGLNLTQISPLAPNQKIGYDLGLLLICTKRRLSIRPGLSLISIGGKFDDLQVLRSQYVSLPINFSYLLRKAVVLGLPGGYRASLTPYTSKLINQPHLPVSSMDYGTKVGFSAFIGDTSQLEAQLGYQLGLKDIGWQANSGLYNRGLYFSVTFVP